jgi:hypothetical protein
MPLAQGRHAGGDHVVIGMQRFDALARKPCSVVAKGRIVNSGALGGPHGVAVSFQFAPRLRPSTVTDVLLLAVQNCVNIVAEPAATVTTTTAG